MFTKNSPLRITNAREFRKSLPAADLLLCSLLRKKPMGFCFRRQTLVGFYTLDFYCADLQLAIETDASAQLSEEGRHYDRQRLLFFERKGIRVVRIRTVEIESDTAGSMQRIIREITQQAMTLRKKGNIFHALRIPPRKPFL